MGNWLKPIYLNQFQKIYETKTLFWNKIETGVLILPTCTVHGKLVVPVEAAGDQHAEAALAHAGG
jgi:hypothetical protein